MNQDVPPPIHPFPARMAPSCNWTRVLSGANKSLLVLDPMAGSGTTLATCRLLGHRSIGFDLDPLAVMMSRVYSQNLAPRRLTSIAATIVQRARKMHDRGASYAVLNIHDDEETREFVARWFRPHVQDELACLHWAIREIAATKDQPFFWCALSRTIISKTRSVAQAIDLPHSRPRYTPECRAGRPLIEFLSAVKLILSKSEFTTRRAHELPPAKIRQGDARNLRLQEKCVDLIITSPPYLNAIDYMRGHKFSLVWTGYSVSELRAIRSIAIGSEVSSRFKSVDASVARECLKFENLDASDRKKRIVFQFIADMNAMLSEQYRVLKPGGALVLVIANNKIGGKTLQMASCVRRLATLNSFAFEGQRCRTILASRRYLPPPDVGRSDLMDGRMNKEFTLTFKRPPAH